MADQADQAAKPGEQKEPPKKPPRKMGPGGWLVVLVVVAGAAIGGVLLWGYLQSYESTDDAQIDGDIYAITSRISGSVKAVYVQDNQQVKAGQLLVELDPADYRVSVEQAKAAVTESQTQTAAVQPNVSITSATTQTTVSSSQSDIAAARAQVAGTQRDYESAVADIRQAEADSVKAQSDLVRYKQLIAKDEISQQQYDQAEAQAKAMAAVVDARKATAEAAARNIDAARARLEQAQTRSAEAIQTRPQQIQLQNAMVQARRAATDRERTMLDQAMLNLSYTRITAPVDGVIGKKNAEAGQQVSPGQQLMAAVPVANLWVTANFKETQLQKMHPGQRVTIHVDSYNRDYEGYVESVAAASGARFSLLPPENATGNFVKVVQRVPVRIRLKQGEDSEHRLRPGMSAEPKVWLDSK
ncbi:MAG: HlyD family secretion protein [Acidobacteriota bacterium]|nr:HlyD family secretion protein [Acidobacteriota bacterium]